MRMRVSSVSMATIETGVPAYGQEQTT